MLTNRAFFTNVERVVKESQDYRHLLKLLSIATSIEAITLDEAMFYIHDFGGRLSLACAHENTIDIGDEEHMAVGCTDCEKILEPKQDPDDLVSLHEMEMPF